MCCRLLEKHYLSGCGVLQIIVAERGPLVFVFNFSPFNDYEGYKVPCLLSTILTYACCAPASCMRRCWAVQPVVWSLRMRWYVGCRQVGTMEAGKFRAVLSSDDPAFGGQGRINSKTEHFTHPEGTPGGAWGCVGGCMHGCHSSI